MKKILFKIRQFPHLSETFVLAQIITAIRADLNINVLVSEVLDFKNSTHGEVLEKYRIEEKIILENYKIPKSRFGRVTGAFLLFLKHIPSLKHLVSFLRHKKDLSLTWIYQYEFYSQFRDYDIIHVQYGTNVHPVDILKKVNFLTGRLIVSFHGHDAFFPINGFIPNNGYYNHLFRGDNMIVANTPFLAGVIEKLGCPRENIRTIPVGVDIDFFHPLETVYSSEEELRIITVGRLSAIKGHEYAIDAIKILKDRGFEVKLSIVGEGDRKSYLEEKIVKLNLEDTVLLLGRMDQLSIRDHLQKSDLFLFTSVPLKDGRRETQGLVTLEAQACGLPVVAFDSGGIRFTFEDKETGFLCKELDVECLADKITKFLDVDLRRAMSIRSRNHVVNFSQKNLDEVWSKIYKEV